jgi:hypothetical protein
MIPISVAYTFDAWYRFQRTTLKTDGSYDHAREISSRFRE